MKSRRRLILGGLCAALATAAEPLLAAAPFHGLRVTLLGTAGGPPPHVDQSQPANLLQIGGKSYVIDAGENVGQQVMRAGIPPNKVDVLFITHLHWDHTLGLGYLMATGWMMGRVAPLPIWGPPGLADYVGRENEALKVSEDIFRPQIPNRPELDALYPVHEVDLTQPTEIYHDENVRVTAAPTTHYVLEKGDLHSYGADKAYAYRFDTADGSVTFTGDTGPSTEVIKLAHGSDVLVSEVCDIDSIQQALVATVGRGQKLDALMAHMHDEHLSPEDVGRMATAAGVKRVVLTHFVAGPGANPDGIAAKVRAYFKGDVIAGKDLETIDLPAR